MTTTDPTEPARAFLTDKDNDPADLRGHLGSAGQGAGYAAILIALLGSPDKRAKNRAAKLVANLAGSEPGAVTPHLDRLLDLAASDQTILKWNATAAIGLAATAASRKTIDAAVPLLVAQLDDPSMVTAGHAITALGRVAAAHPRHLDAVAGHLVDAPANDPPPRDPSCREILAGKSLAALEPLCASCGQPQRSAIKQFAEAHAGSERPSTRRAAAKVVKALG